MKKSWLSFCQKLDTGSRLIMGIKFPSEPKGVSVNQFIREVLNFKPKLLILICPKDMERDRLNGNESAYGLVWEDSEILSSESHLKETSCSSQQRKLEPPLLSLYSRLDWTKTYNTTALKLGHLSNGQNDFDIGTGHIGEKVSREPTDSNCFTDITNQINSIPEETSEEDRLTAQFDPNARAWTSMLFAPAPFTLKNGSVGWLDD
ncbi:hypothetical protein IFM89_022791 [Coptis chinensis]|uniref:DM2 domain-containing protein n=1 Tax=Coptis chinensis TaxID=261450 RepID=A0A835M4K6_9MAGN|nr:hypothetical protein IFM89_022791 [Coptis chinensis]